ncbi:hypothetical protein EG832_07760 [bacterium]|nr:hypothetical protein [bacterium]
MSTQVRTRETQTDRGGVSGFLYSFIYHFPKDQPYLELITRNEAKIKEAMETELNRIIDELLNKQNDMP